MKPKIWSDQSYLSHKTEEWIHGQNGGKKTKFWGVGGSLEWIYGLPVAREGGPK